MPYIESLADFWGDLCGSREAAPAWADRLIGITRMAISPDKDLHGHFHGTSACFSALYHAERYGEIVDILQANTLWTYQRWAVKALAAMGRKGEAVRYAESCRGPWTPDGEVDAICEEILLSSGSIDQAYEQYGLRANRGGTYVATSRSVAKKYPHKSVGQILADLVRTTPDDEGKCFAAAKEAGLHDEDHGCRRLGSILGDHEGRRKERYDHGDPRMDEGACRERRSWRIRGRDHRKGAGAVMSEPEP